MPDRVAPAEDTREWTLEIDRGNGYTAIWDGVTAIDGGCEYVEVVEKSALTAAVLAREEAERELEREKRAHGDTRRREREWEDAYDALVKARGNGCEHDGTEEHGECDCDPVPAERVESQLQEAREELSEALDVIERCVPHIRRPSLLTALLRKHGRLPG